MKDIWIKLFVKKIPKKVISIQPFMEILSKECRNGIIRSY